MVSYRCWLTYNYCNEVHLVEVLFSFNQTVYKIKDQKFQYIYVTMKQSFIYVLFNGKTLFKNTANKRFCHFFISIYFNSLFVTLDSLTTLVLTLADFLNMLAVHQHYVTLHKLNRHLQTSYQHKMSQTCHAVMSQCYYVKFLQVCILCTASAHSVSILFSFQQQISISLWKNFLHVMIHPPSVPFWLFGPNKTRR